MRRMHPCRPAPDSSLPSSTRAPPASSKNCAARALPPRSEEHTSELQSPCNLVCRPLLETKRYAPVGALPITRLQTACILCSRNCELEVEVASGHLEQIRGDGQHPVSAGHLCQKAPRLDR